MKNTLAELINEYKSKTNYLQAIHSVTGGNHEDTSEWVAEAARELARRVDWYYNGKLYRAAAELQTNELLKYPNTERTREDIAEKIATCTPYNIEAVQEIIENDGVDVSYTMWEELFEKYNELYDINPVPINRYAETELNANIIIAPEEVKHPGKVNISIDSSNNTISVTYMKNEEFRALIKKLNYNWDNGSWKRTLNNLNGTVIDRVAELANKLLTSGFTTSVPDEEIKNKALNADYEEECRNWITSCKSNDKHKNHLRVIWDKRNEKLYNRIRSIGKTRYESGIIYVAIDMYKEILDFARLHDFKIEPSAQADIDKYKNSIETVNVNKKEIIEPIDKLQEILKTAGEVIDDLKDDDI